MSYGLVLFQVIDWHIPGEIKYMVLFKRPEIISEIVN
jgi:hypothetical protein